MIEKEELRSRINKILRDDIGREVFDRTADRIIDAILGEHPPEPRVGQICEMWDGGFNEGLHVSIIRSVSTTSPRYMDQEGNWWRHAKVCRDPLTLGRTQAPKGAEWIAPYWYDMWAFYKETPELDGGDDVFFSGNNILNSSGHVQTFPAPTEGCGPIKLWEEEDESND